MSQDKSIDYYCADYHQLGWDPESIDGALFMESLCYSLVPEQVLAEVARALRPGARLVVTDGYLTRPLSETSHIFQSIFRRVTSNWAVPSYHQIQHAENWSRHAGLNLVEKRDISWNLAPTALQSVPLTMYCSLKLWLKGERSLWRWRQLVASGLALMLGLQRHNFRYYLLTFEKPS